MPKMQVQKPFCNKKNIKMLNYKKHTGIMLDI